MTSIRSNSWDAQLTVPNDPRYAQWEKNLGIRQAKEGQYQCRYNLVTPLPIQFLRARHHSKRRRRWVGVKGSTRNGRRDCKYPSTKCLRIVREVTGTPNENATCAWMSADKAVGCTRAFLRCGDLLDD
ncbi:uncharacterized protein TNCV_2101321 [Trichonephila clavipes]|nr:uncharacterized protein TNCV_2101321 [Trichonephila clavipes]